MKVLMTGGSGQIGEALLADIYSFLPPIEIDLTLLTHTSPVNTLVLRNSTKINLTNTVTGRFDVAIHLAAIINTPFCQKPENHHLVLETNVGLTKTVCEHSDFVVLISTDNVFNGNERRELREDDMPNPCNFYGISKMEAEEIVAANGGAVVRVQTMLGCRNILTTAIVDTIRGKVHPPFWNDTYSRPSFVPDLVKTLKVLLEHRAEGIYHCSTIGDVFSRAEIAKRVLDFFLEHNLPHQINSISEEPCSVPSFPRYLVLNSEETRSKLGLDFSSSVDALNKHLSMVLSVPDYKIKEV